VVGFGTLLLVWAGAGGSLWHRVGERRGWTLSLTLAGMGTLLCVGIAVIVSQLMNLLEATCGRALTSVPTLIAVYIPIMVLLTVTVGNRWAANDFMVARVVEVRVFLSLRYHLYFLSASIKLSHTHTAFK
jgi:hypothetical protein